MLSHPIMTCVPGKKKMAPWISFLPSIHHFPLLPLYLFFLPAKPADIFVCLSCCYTTCIEGGEMAISQTEISQHSKFRSPKLKCVTGGVSLPAVVLLFLYTCCENTQSNFGKGSGKEGKKDSCSSNRPWLTVSASSSSFCWSLKSRHYSPLPIFFFTWAISPHCYIFVMFQRSHIPYLASLLFL